MQNFNYNLLLLKVKNKLTDTWSFCEHIKIVYINIFYMLLTLVLLNISDLILIGYNNK